MIPPTFAAARKTYSGFSAAKNSSTALLSVRSSSLCVRPIILVYPLACNERVMAEPTNPWCPATYILQLFSITCYFKDTNHCVADYMHTMVCRYVICLLFEIVKGFVSTLFQITFFLH